MNIVSIRAYDPLPSQEIKCGFECTHGVTDRRGCSHYPDLRQLGQGTQWVEA